jgi:hypothetical protein
MEKSWRNQQNVFEITLSGKQKKKGPASYVATDYIEEQLAAPTSPQWQRIEVISGRISHINMNSRTCK